MNTIFDLPQHLTIHLATEPNPATPKIRLMIAPEKPAVNMPNKSVGDILYTDNQVIVSLGDSANKISAETFRKAGGSLAKWLVQHNVAEINLYPDEISSYQIPNAIPAFYEGLLLGAFQFERYKKIEASVTPVQVWVHAQPNEQTSAQEQIERSSRLCAAVNLARDWADRKSVV